MELHTHNGLDSPKIDVDGAFIGATALLTHTDQTVAGVKTLSSTPVLPASDPTTDNQLVRKAYADTVAATFPDYTLGVSSTRLVDSAPTTRDVAETQSIYTILKKITYKEANATITIKFDMQNKSGAGTAYGLLYKNGVSAGTEQTATDDQWHTFSENISVATNDYIELKGKFDNSGGGTGANYRNFGFYYTKTLDITAGTVNQD
jgi:hypothetical protein